MAHIEEEFQQINKLEAVKQNHIVKNGINVHKCLTLILLCGKTTLTSKGKSLQPNKKQEKNLLTSIRNFQLAVDLLLSSTEIDDQATIDTS